MTVQADGFSGLRAADQFIDRHIGISPSDRAHMLQTLGLASLDALLDGIVPEAIRERAGLELAEPMDEAAALSRLRALAAQNTVLRSCIGQGYYGTHTPPVILRNVMENPAWYTAYTPYQAEIAQGRLEALLTFQTMVADLTGLEIAGASLLDEATAAAEAMSLCHRVNRKAKGETFLVATDVHPQTIDILETRAAPLGIEIVVGDVAELLEQHAAFGVLLQYPASDGAVHDPRRLIQAARAKNAMVVMASDLLALTLLTPPGELGADVAVGSAQRFGVPMGYGGPHAAFMATHDAHKRAMPGRMVGVSIDSHGRPAYRLALQTREQHIRREKATSNICTAQVLLAVMAAMYAVYHGPDGLARIARRVHRLTAQLAQSLSQAGHAPVHESFFDTILIETGARTDALMTRARDAGYNLRRFDDRHIAIALDETTEPADLEALCAVFDTEPADFPDTDALPAALRRQSGYLGHAVFHEHRSETQMLRYLRQLADKDIALDRAMIPLGSCTMKLNATAEMMPVTWPAFADLHPFAPVDQAKGYAGLIAELEQMLCAATGYDAVSLQPNAGSQGEYAGLLAIRAYHLSRGDDQRDICLIPSSAHGTNPASAQMAGLRVVVVGCDGDGNVDIEDLRAKIDQHQDQLAALMVTYPSTHGVFEESITEICAMVHDAGGQVYLDGANLNALVGLAAPGHFGADVSHLNLHKTFCIPHGGGGPGVGPIGVRQHLALFMPGHRYLSDGPAGGPVSAAPYGSAGILPISYTYILMMGARGLRSASAHAILAANYIAKRLEAHYPVLYRGRNGGVAHECILDCRPLKDSAGVGVDDIAKRLMDFGFHAPTMSWPVAGTLMIEPTESESLAELDRFCDAMIAIRREIAAIERGDMAYDQSPLALAPHTAEDVTAASWDRPYSREQAAFPVPGLRATKYWPPVGRIDNVYGDRHVVCTCPPLDAYKEAAE
ncbi:MAG: aminomethyl-transferring glycine dehydrogenase [Geminicoccaceae bacterium]